MVLQVARAARITVSLYLSLYPDSLSRREKSESISALLLQGTERLVFLMIQMASCVRVERFTRSGIADLASMTVREEQGFL